MFGWQRPCYLLGEGYAKTFKELMEDTDWDNYGTGNYEKCADCMVHCGYEASAVMDTRAGGPGRRPGWRCAASAPRARWRRRSPWTNQRPAEYVFSRNVAEKLDEIRQTTPNPKKISTAA